MTNADRRAAARACKQVACVRGVCIFTCPGVTIIPRESERGLGLRASVANRERATGYAPEWVSILAGALKRKRERERERENEAV